ncbi:hypothetical protein AKG98_1977 [Moritella sp. JT01]|uniref:hypothetical protein n=1 Tax=Moritella sp. JT01 TaxID=756698 RepID=UPI0007921BED|nr:hypothetical protein [Moritella sp. JT01]KXO08378.1 hypothetical protein AKG98_1977 [Moritella sp. JT01]
MTRSFFDIKKSFFLYLFSFCIISIAYIPFSNSAEITDNDEQSEITHQALTPSNITPSQSYLVFLNIFDRKDIWGELPWELSDQNIRTVALYHTGDRLQHQLDKTTLSLIENKLSLSLIDNDIRVKTCVQCSKTYITVKNGSVRVKHSAETNKELQTMAKDIRANAFLMWDASVHDDVYDLQLKLVNAKTMDVIWAKNISETVEINSDIGFSKKSDWAVTLGVWGLEAKRLNTSTGKATIVDKFTTIGVRNNKSSGFTPYLDYAIIFDAITNLENRDIINLAGVNIEGRILLLMPDWNQKIKFKPYIGIGQILFKNYHAVAFRVGTEISFPDNGSLELGIISVPKHNIDAGSKSGYASEITFGGISFDITLSFRL